MSTALCNGQRVRVGFSTSNALISRVIRFFSGQRFSHAFLIYEDRDFGGQYVMEAAWDGYRLIHRDDALRDATLVVILDPKHDLSKILEVSGRWLGSRYDYAGLVGAALVTVARWARTKIRNPMQDAKSVFCSESIVVGLQQIGYPGAERLDAASTTPTDLFKFFKSE